MITGYNANIPHGGRLFHVQTEDSGRSHPHVITHLYYEGTIFSSEKCEYAEILTAPDLTARVRKLMEEQHAAMVERLRGGAFDTLIDARLAKSGAPAASPGDTLTPALPRSGPPSRAEAPARAREFGEGIVSPRPLDEVILDYLVEKSRDRKSGGGRGSRSEG